MDPIYYVIVAILMALAVSDLVVGVSNDAVNFLNSALGSKAAPRWVIMTVASVGILFGAIFSSGMMEVARSGIFFPSEFDFNSVMMIFLAVMFTDVILLDMFNTLGLPTSTTVSLVFELLGSAVAVALVNIWASDPNMASALSDYINSSKALAIISGILISVVVSFVTGMIVMYVSRLVFTFKYKKSFKYIGSIWCGIALTAISYFAVFKGLKDTTIMNAELKEFLNNTSTIVTLLCSFGFWTVIMGLIQHIFRLNILKLTVLAGTLSLALAFAGNDLVNFIGVFMAGKNTFDIGLEAVNNGASMADVSAMKMVALEGKVQANWLYLFAAGAIMTLTLWFSKKARKVTETEINLASQDSEGERFGSSLVSRTIVRSAVSFNKAFIKITPSPVQRWISKRFEPCIEEGADKAPFDLIRATVNLTAASILIASATSLKLPLSTTYVTFMVAMGSSLADRAWGRETAVYRITGVLTVISGWFLTAFIAFSVAFIIAMLLMYGGVWAIAGIGILCIYMIYHSRKSFKRKRKEEEAKAAAKADKKSILESSQEDMVESMSTMADIYEQTMEALFTEDYQMARKSHKKAKKFLKLAKERSETLHSELRGLNEAEVATGSYYAQVVDFINEVAVALTYITMPARQHLDNNHHGFSKEQNDELKQIGTVSKELYIARVKMLRNGDSSNMDKIIEKRQRFDEILSRATKLQIERVVGKQKTSSRTSLLYLTILNETKTMAHHSNNLFEAQLNFVKNK
ncbi:MAG: inorganic phosphate transporter [Rikenellaceae bacterium]